MVLARELGPTEFGLFFAVFTFVSFFGFFKDAGLGYTLVKYIPEFEVKKKYHEIKSAIFSVFIVKLVSSSILGVVLFLLADYLSIHYFKDPLSSTILKFLVLMFIFMTFWEVIRTVFMGFQKMFYYSFMDFLSNFIVFLIIAALFYCGVGIMAPTYAYVAIGPIMFFICTPLFLKIFNFFGHKGKFSFHMLKRLFSFGLPILLGSMGSTIIAYVDVLVLMYYRTLAEVGIYNVVYPSAMVFLFFGKALANVMLPMVSELWARREKKKVAGALNFLYNNYFVFLMPIIFSVLAFAGLFISIFFGEDYSSGALALQILLIGVVINAFANINNSILVGIGKPRIVTLLVTLSSIINLILDVLLIPKFGIEGAALATTIAFTAWFLLSMHSIGKFIKAEIPWRNWLKVLISSLMFVVLVFFMKNALSLNVWLEIAISLITAGAVYLALIFAMKAIDLDEIKTFIRMAIK